MSQISLNTIPGNPIDLGTGQFTWPFVRFIQAMLRNINLANAAVSNQTVIATAGGSLVVNNTALFIFLTPASSISGYKIEFPESPVDGSELTIKTTAMITGLVLTAPTPDSILDPALALAMNGVVKYTYLLSSNLWVRSG